MRGMFFANNNVKMLGLNKQSGLVRGHWRKTLFLHDSIDIGPQKKQRHYGMCWNAYQHNLEYE